jgi:hypothetical protein
MDPKPFDRDEARPDPSPRAFRLYPDGPDQHWWSRNDYGAVVDAMATLQASGRPIGRVLEFGPGWSTRALIEGGAVSIDTLEDNPDWAATHEARLVKQFPGTVRLIRYAWQEPLAIPAIDGEHYDLAFIDGPLGSNQRPEVLRYALAHATAVLLPTEDRNPALRKAIKEIAGAQGLTVEIRETGPLSGGFALLTRPITPTSANEHRERRGAPPIQTPEPVEIQTADVPELLNREAEHVGMSIVEDESLPPAPAPSQTTGRRSRKRGKA